MQRFKLSFLAIVAISAMSFTVVSNVKPTNVGLDLVLDDSDCFIPSVNSKVRINCSSELISLQPTSCANAKANYGPPAVPFRHLWALDTPGFIESNVDDIACPDNSGDFCCFNIEIDFNPSLECEGTVNDQPQIAIPAFGTLRYYRVKGIRCHEVE